MGRTRAVASDIDRIERQQDFIKRLGRLAVLKATDDPSIAPDIADHLIPQPHRRRSRSTASSFNELVRAFMGLSEDDGSGPTFETLPVEDG